ncbi:MAG: hypothetical protein PHS93_08180 [Candidatus Omnitrophica bacterium]|nr:hypothetical protein [Candidatus Omnitrophota bacterium]
MTAREIVAKLRNGEVCHIKKELFEKFKEEIVKHNLLDITECSKELLWIHNDFYCISLFRLPVLVKHN